MRSNREMSPAAAAAELVLPEGTAFDAATIFGRSAPLEVDLGCGDGSFLAQMAHGFPERDFVGVEKLLGRVRSACRKIAARGLPNARILRTDIQAAVTELLPPGSVAVCHLLFPDPWPKRRHHVRRTVSPEWLRSVARVLTAGGFIRLVTDDADYFAHMQRALAAVPELRRDDDHDARAYPVTTFEKRFRDRGLPIHFLVGVKVAPDV
jgi:tRNA (guanine-N7-)-methyltransferase